jgi:hypothetical protein
MIITGKAAAARVKKINKKRRGKIRYGVAYTKKALQISISRSLAPAPSPSRFMPFYSFIRDSFRAIISFEFAQQTWQRNDDDERAHRRRRRREGKNNFLSPYYMTMNELYSHLFEM